MTLETPTTPSMSPVSPLIGTTHRKLLFELCDPWASMPMSTKGMMSALEDIRYVTPFKYSISLFSLILTRWPVDAHSFIFFLILHVSGSAYKIVNKRAYHHGTMLISTRLSSLGDLLHTTKETMVTKGVASVRSPVQNLQYFNPSVVHEAFENATIKAFQEHYNISEEVIYVEADAYSQVPEIQHSMDELQSWDWLFGQTPEFTYSFSQSFDWGEMKVEIRSKHGRITACDFKGRGVDQTVVRLIRDKAVGLRYGEMGKPEDLDWKSLEVPKSLQAQEIWNWIQAETSI